MTDRFLPWRSIHVKPTDFQASSNLRSLTVEQALITVPRTFLGDTRLGTTKLTLVITTRTCTTGTLSFDVGIDLARGGVIHEPIGRAGSRFAIAALWNITRATTRTTNYISRSHLTLLTTTIIEIPENKMSRRSVFNLD